MAMGCVGNCRPGANADNSLLQIAMWHIFKHTAAQFEINDDAHGAGLLLEMSADGRNFCIWLRSGVAPFESNSFKRI